MFSNSKQHLEGIIGDIKDAGLYKSERVINGRGAGVMCYDF